MPKPLQRSPSKTIAIILSGGAGTRLNGADKGLQEYNGSPLITSVIERVSNQVDAVVICANRNIEHYAEFGLPVVQDQQQDFQGPLAGVVSALEFIASTPEYDEVSHALICTCDSPALPNDYVMQLSNGLMSEPNPVAVVHDGQRKQNLHCLIARSAWGSLVEFYTEGGRAMHRWHKKAGVTEVDFSDQADCFLNVNSLEQLH